MTLSLPFINPKSSQKDYFYELNQIICFYRRADAVFLPTSAADDQNQQGDRAHLEFANRLTAVIRSTAVVTRIGGDDSIPGR